MGAKKAEHDEDAGAYFDREHGKLTIGRVLRSIRLGDEKTLSEFSELLGIPLAHLSDMEHGRRAVTVERAAKWADVLGYPRATFVQLALQSELDKAGIDLQVTVQVVPAHSAKAPRAKTTKLAKSKALRGELMKHGRGRDERMKKAPQKRIARASA